MADRRNPAGLAVELSLHLRLWREAVELEADRLRTAPTIAHRHIDGYFLVVAIRQVLLSAEAMNKAIKGDGHLANALAHFLADHPQAKEMRDVLIHFDEYERGTGILQEVGELDADRLAVWLGIGEDSTTLSLAPGLMLELVGASSAALRLADETQSAFDRFLVRHKASGSTVDR